MGEDDRSSILARRARFIATALAGLAIAPGGIQACGDDVADDGGQGGEPQPCLDMPPPGGGGQGGQGGAQACLTAPLGGGGEGGGTGGLGGTGGTGGSGGTGGAG